MTFEVTGLRSYLEEDFEVIKQRFDVFWDREVLDRPLIHITAPRKPRRDVTLQEEEAHKVLKIVEKYGR